MPSLVRSGCWIRNVGLWMIVNMMSMTYPTTFYVKFNEKA